jgi:murein DD-endopeptidase MepM/ murein hydrolase activator NlpD
MNIILIPGQAGKGGHISFTARQVAVVALVMVLFLPMMMGVLAYRIHDLLAEKSYDPAYLLNRYRHFSDEYVAVETARREAGAQFDVLAQRLGHLQAHIMRLNALGSRLTRIAGLDRREFDFSAQPALGGPQTDAANLTVPDFLQALEELSAEIESRKQRLQALETVMVNRKVIAQNVPIGWPMDGGWVSSIFGRRADPFTGRVAFHSGVDIAGKMGGPIRSMGVGVVTFAGEKDGYGLTVEINHGNGEITRYAHAQAILARVGDRVNKGDSIALVGSSGRSTGPHLHVEVLRNGHIVDPRTYLRMEGASDV